MDEAKLSKREQLDEDFKTAMVLEFNDLYGTDENDITCWWGLCKVLGVNPLPDTLNECKKVKCPLSMRCFAFHQTLIY